MLEQSSKNLNKEETFQLFHNWVDYVRNWLMYVVVFRFDKSYDSILKGNYKNNLFYDTFHQFTIEILQNIMVEYVFQSENIVKLELAAQTIINSLLNKFVPILQKYDTEQKLTKAEKKIINIIPANYLQDYELAKKDDDYAFNEYLRILIATDYISGMTDSYAKNLYQELNGIY